MSCISRLYDRAPRWAILLYWVAVLSATVAAATQILQLVAVAASRSAS